MSTVANVASNHKHSRSHFIRVKTNSTASLCKDRVRQWLLLCIHEASPDHLKGCARVVCGVCDEDVLEEDEESCLRYGRGPHNEIVAALYVSGDNFSFPGRKPIADEDMLVEAWDFSDRVIASDAIRDAMLKHPSPGCVVAAGVSALPSAEVKQYWNEIVTEHANCMAIAGKGEMMHPMWCRWDEDLEWFYIRERSFNFTWLD